MPPTWLTYLAWFSIAIAIATSVAIAADVFVRGYRQRMWIMDVVWPVTALYFGPAAWLGWTRWGRPASVRSAAERASESTHGEAASVAIGVSHCGAGCTLGDIIGAWLVFAASWTLLGLALPAEYVVDFALAFTLGIAFQYFSIAPMRNLGLADGIVAAVKADTLSLTAFEVGLFAWMAVVQLVLFTDPHLEPNHAAYWFLMQIGMVIGFGTAYPANVWLIRHRLKEAM